ncbi:hypothetical protein DFH09DRAFT_1435806, partial [Mycena vulgaris]
MSSETLPRRSSRRPPVKAPAESTTPSRHRPAVAPDIQELQDLADELNKFSYDNEWCPFLSKLQEVLDHHQPGLMNVFPTPITWKDSKVQKMYAQAFVDHADRDFTGMRTLKQWIDNDAARGHHFSLAVMTTPASNPVAVTREEYAKQPQHIWLLMTAHAPDGTNGKTIITYNTDVEKEHNESRERRSLGFEHSYVKYIRETPGRSRDRVWQNRPVPGGKPYAGDCYKYTMQ